MEGIIDDIIDFFVNPHQIKDHVYKINNLETLKLLIKKFPSLLNTDPFGFNLINYTIKNSKLEIIKYMIENYPNLVISNIHNHSRNILFMGIHNKNVECVKYLFKKFPHLILQKDSRGYTIVTLSFCCDKKVINFLMQTIPDLYLEEIDRIVKLSQGGYNCDNWICMGIKNIRNLYPIFSKIPELINDQYVRDTLIECTKQPWEYEKIFAPYTKSIFSENKLILPLTFQIDN